MRKDIADDLRVFDEDDDPHGSLKYWVDQRVSLTTPE
jgi:hypothetical protein